MDTAEQTAASGRIGRGQLVPGQLWQLPTFLIGLLTFLAVAVSAPVRHPLEWWQFDAAVDELRQGLQKNQDPSTLVSLAETVLLKVHLFGDRAGEVHFLAGSAYYRQALANPPAQSHDLWERAIEHLEEAQALQLSADDRDGAALQYRLGRALYALGRDVPRALDLMARSIDKGAEQPLAAYQMLLQAYHKVPDLDAAIEASRKVIELTDERDPDAPAQARLSHVELLLRKQLVAEAIKELDRIGPKVSRPLRLKAKLMQVSWCEQEGMWSKALAIWQDVLPDAAQVPGGRARVQYAIGWCSAQLEIPDYARADAAWQDALKFGGTAGQAAGLRLGGLRLFGPAPDTERGLENWRLAMAELPAGTEFQNPFLEVSDVRSLFEHALSMFLDGQDYEKMRLVAELYRKVAPAGQGDEKLAQAAEAQAKKLQSEPAPPAEQVRALYRQAAEAYVLAAKARPGKQSFDILWRSADCFLRAQDADHAAAVLSSLDQLDRADVRLADGWFRLAESERTAGHADKARPAYLRSMQYAATPFAARARYQLALEAADRKKWREAEEILQPNLNGIAADRDAHEKSLYQMAWIQLQKQDFSRALFYLADATGKYQNSPWALVARAQIPDCYRKLADQAYRQGLEERNAFSSQAEDRKYEIQELVRRLQEKRAEWLRDAAKAYRKLADDLRDTERKRQLTKLEGSLARRAVLGMGECHHDLGEYLEALRLYQGLMQRNRCTVETLIACERIFQLRDLATTVADLLPPEGKREVMTTAGPSLLLQVQDDLAKMDPSAVEFQGDGVWNWQRWQQWIVAAQARLGAPGGPATKTSSIK
jgi:hypothetical protein